tara:strand:- start:604 stop:1791 length:1188 start_codon:yes stop_codon:yes gene_type:complete
VESAENKFRRNIYAGKGGSSTGKGGRSRLQSLLGVVPLQNLSNRNNSENPFGQSLFGMQSPINTNFQNLAPIKTQSPFQKRENYFNGQMQKFGLQNPDALSIIDPEDGTGGYTGDGASNDYFGEGGVQDEGYGPAMERFKTDTSSLMSSFFSALNPTEASQYTEFTNPGSQGGENLSIQELAALAGFEYADAAPGTELHAKLEAAGIGRYADALANLPGELSNLQELRGGMFGKTLEEASSQQPTLLQMTDAESTSGILSNRTTQRKQEATKTLESALERQLMANESTYLGELDSLMKGTVGQLKENLSNLTEDVLANNADLAEYLGGTGNPGEFPHYVSSAISSYGLSQSETTLVNSYVSGIFDSTGQYPSQQEVIDWIQSNFGDEQDQGDSYE